jgi:hypothetical protein
MKSSDSNSNNYYPIFSLKYQKRSSDLVTELKNRDELILCEGQELGTFDVHLLAFEHFDQSHLFLERLHELVPLLLQTAVVLDELLHVATYGLTLTLLGSLGFAELVAGTLELLERPVELGVLGAKVLVLASLLALCLVQIPFLLLEVPGDALQFFLELAVLRLQLLDLDLLLLDLLVELLDLSIGLLVFAGLLIKLDLLKVLSLQCVLQLRLERTDLRLLYVDDLSLLS